MQCSFDKSVKYSIPDTLPNSNEKSIRQVNARLQRNTQLLFLVIKTNIEAGLKNDKFEQQNHQSAIDTADAGGGKSCKITVMNIASTRSVAIDETNKEVAEIIKNNAACKQNGTTDAGCTVGCDICGCVSMASVTCANGKCKTYIFSTE